MKSWFFAATAIAGLMMSQDAEAGRRRHGGSHGSSGGLSDGGHGSSGGEFGWEGHGSSGGGHGGFHGSSGGWGGSHGGHGSSGGFHGWMHGGHGSSGGAHGFGGHYGSHGSSGGAFGGHGSSGGWHGGHGSSGGYGSVGHGAVHYGSGGHVGGLVAPGHPVVAVPVQEKAQLVMSVPEAADVYMLGRKMTLTGDTRKFVTPKLESGKVYTLTIRVEWQNEGKTYVAQGEQKVRGGDRIELEARLNETGSELVLGQKSGPARSLGFIINEAPSTKLAQQ